MNAEFVQSMLNSGVFTQEQYDKFCKAIASNQNWTTGAMREFSDSVESGTPPQDSLAAILNKYSDKLNQN